MDWRRLTSEIQTATTLTEAERRDLVARLEADEPDTGGALRRYIERAGRARSFMQTSAGIIGGPPAGALEPGVAIGVWRIESLIGAGGMGEVYRARRNDGLYEQTVALKLMQGGDADRSRRFERERQRLARLDHPGVSRIIDGGAAPDGRPYMVMELVDGRPIDAFADGEALSRAQRLALFVELCAAVSHAHGKLILHRDIKPANVLVDREGKVRLIDFGVAALLDGDDLDGGGPLTIAYAAPEQLAHAPLSVATDVFALGVLLHHLVTERLPERRPDGGVDMDATALGSADLAAIAARATAFAPEDRYRSVETLGEDIRALIEGRPVAARGAGRVYRLRKLLTRFPVASGLAAALSLALTAGLITSLLLAERALREARRASEELSRAEHYLARSDLLFRAQSAYADVLQRMFGGEADVERLTEVLLDRWREAHARRAEDPEEASFLSYAIGRHFLFRNDHVTAAQILEPWISEAYGEPALLMEGRDMLGIVYQNLGRGREAEALLREVEAALAAGFDAWSSDHARVATQLAAATGDADDRRRAEEVTLAALAGDIDARERSNLWNQLAFLRRERGDFDGAYEAAVSALDALDDDPLSGNAGKDSLRLNVTQYEFYHRRDFDRTEALAQLVISEEGREKGINRNVGIAQQMIGLAAAERGDLERAEDMLRDALSNIERFAGSESVTYVVTAAALSGVLADQGEAQEAAELIATVRAGLDDDGARHEPLLTLAELYVAVKQDGTERAREMGAAAAFDRERIARNMTFTYFYDRVADMGVLDPL